MNYRLFTHTDVSYRFNGENDNVVLESMIYYGSISRGSTSILNIERINKLQNRVARIILKVDYTTPSAEMFQQLGWVAVPQQINYNKAVSTYKAINDLTPA